MASERPIVHWIGSDGGFLVASLAAPGPLTAVGYSLLADGDHKAAIAKAKKLELEIVVETEASRNQLPDGHPLRRPLAAAGIEWESFDIGAEPFSDARSQEIAEQHTDALARAKSDWLANPVHAVDDTVPLSLSRRNEIEIAKASVEVARSRGPTAPATERRRRVVSTMGVFPKQLKRSWVAVRELIAAWSEVTADLYVVRAWRFSGSRPQYEVLRSLARGMEAKTGKPCLIDGIGTLLYGVLRNRVSGGFANRGALEPLPIALDDDDDEFEYSVDPWAPQILGRLGWGEKRDQARMALFSNLLCGCSVDHAGQAPRGLHACLIHNFYWELTELDLALAADPERVIGELGPRVHGAERERKRLNGVGRLPSGWLASLEFYRAAQRPASEAGA